LSIIFNNIIICLNFTVIIFHEELKESVTLCIKDVIHQCSSDVIESFYIKENVQKLGEGILLCLIIARTEKSSVVRYIF